MASLNNAKNNKKARCLSVLCLFIDYDLMNCCKLLINTLEIYNNLPNQLNRIIMSKDIRLKHWTLSICFNHKSVCEWFSN